MTLTDPPSDLANIAASVKRIEETTTRQGDDMRRFADRLDKLERFADKAEGALTIAKFTLSLLGIGGIAAIVAAVSNR